MKIVAQFDPATETQQTFNAGFANGQGRIVVYNESNINLQLSWGSFNSYCPAWTAMLYCISNNNAVINWEQITTLNSVSPPVSMVIVEAYDANEAITGTYPAPLVRQSNIGNAVVNTTGGTSSLLKNDGQAYTEIIEATYGTDTQSSVIMSNQGTLVLGSGNEPGSLVITSPSGNSSFSVDGQTSLGNGYLTIDNTGLLYAGNGMQLGGGTLQLLAGSISRISKFGPYSVSTTAAFFNHNLGAVPDIVILQVTGATGTIRTACYNDGNMTSTQVQLTGSASFNVRGLAIKF